MNTNDKPNDIAKPQAALVRLALALDSYLVNGIPSAIINKTTSESFLKLLAERFGQAVSDFKGVIPLEDSEQYDSLSELANRAQTEFDQIQQLIDRLLSFRSLPLPQMHDTISQLVQKRNQCSDTIQELKQFLNLSTSCLESRPAQSQENVESFLANLPQIFDSARQTPKAVVD